MLLLRDVLGFSAAETAAAMDTSVDSVSSALARARRTLSARLPDRSQQQTLQALGEVAGRRLVERFMRSWERADVDAMVELLTDDVEFAMPPRPQWFRGRDAVLSFLRREPLRPGRRWQVRPLEANGQLGCALWLDNGADFEAESITLLTVRGGLVSGVSAFRESGLFTRFGLPEHVPATSPA